MGGQVQSIMERFELYGADPYRTRPFCGTYAQFKEADAGLLESTDWMEIGSGKISPLGSVRALREQLADTRSSNLGALGTRPLTVYETPKDCEADFKRDGPWRWRR